LLALQVPPQAVESDDGFDLLAPHVSQAADVYDGLDLLAPQVPHAVDSDDGLDLVALHVPRRVGADDALGLFAPRDPNAVDSDAGADLLLERAAEASRARFERRSSLLTLHMRGVKKALSKKSAVEVAPHVLQRIRVHNSVHAVRPLDIIEVTEKSQEGSREREIPMLAPCRDSSSLLWQKNPNHN